MLEPLMGGQELTKRQWDHWQRLINELVEKCAMIYIYIHVCIYIYISVDIEQM